MFVVYCPISGMKRQITPDGQPRLISPKKSETPRKVQRVMAVASAPGSNELSTGVSTSTIYEPVMSPTQILESLVNDSNTYDSNIRNVPRTIGARDAVKGDLREETRGLLERPLVQAYLEHLGLIAEGKPCPEAIAILGDSLYSHQAMAMESILVEKCVNTCISTSTSSGKSLAFNLPILSSIVKDPRNATALYIYPTKALTQDQKRVIDLVLEKRAKILINEGFSNTTHECHSAVEVNILDGDVTEQSERKQIMETSNIILTNPDMLHYTILPNHKKHANFLKNLKFIVIDEAHVYDGIFGAHVASVLRRLRRIVDWYGEKPVGGAAEIFSKFRYSPQFIACSATIGNPRQHVSRLIGVLCDKLIDLDGSPTGDRLLCIWNAKDAISETVSVLVQLMRKGVRFIAFCKSRFLIELLTKKVVEVLRKDEGPVSTTSDTHNLVPLSQRIIAYRAGYTSDERRSLERKIFSGNVLGVVATSALELGMDIGSLDVAVSVGYPGSIHSLWQQWGRAGRGTRPALCMLVCAMADPVDEYIASNGDEFLAEPPEDVVLQTDNGTVVKSHLICADIELRIGVSGDWKNVRDIYWPDTAEAVLLAAEKEAPFVKKKSFSIRNIESRQITVTFEGNRIDQLDISRAFFYVYEGAIHSIQGVEYKIVSLSLTTNTAEAVRAGGGKNSVDYFTKVRDVTTVVPAVRCTEIFRGEFLKRGRVDVGLKIEGFYKVKKGPPPELDKGSYQALALPTIRFATAGVWLGLPELAFDDKIAFLGSHGACHAIYIAACQRLLLSSRSDIRCACKFEQQAPSPVCIYDAQNGGMGISDNIFSKMPSFVHIALTRVSSCPCDKGCTRCLMVPSCPEDNKGLDKAATMEFLKLVRDKFDQFDD